MYRSIRIFFFFSNNVDTKTIFFRLFWVPKVWSTQLWKVSHETFKAIGLSSNWKLRMGTFKSVYSSWFDLISRDKHKYTYLRLWLTFLYQFSLAKFEFSFEFPVRGNKSRNKKWPKIKGRYISFDVSVSSRFDFSNIWRFENSRILTGSADFTK